MTFQTITLTWAQAAFLLGGVVAGVAAWYDLRSKLMMVLDKQKNHEAELSSHSERLHDLEHSKSLGR